MRYILLGDVQQGMILAKPIYDEAGRTLIAGNSRISDSYIEKLKNHGVIGLYIDDELSKDVELEEIIPPKLRTDGIGCVSRQDIEGCMEIAKKIVEELLSKKSFSMDMTDLRTYDNYTFSHSVNVAVYVCVIGIGLKMSQEELEKLVLSGLLHDLGKMMIPQEILNKPGKLTPDEYQIMKTHSTLSYEIIKERWDISAKVKEAVLSHHENVDGSGYPNGTTGDKQSVFSKVLHVADVYDALVTKRSYKEPYSPFEAAEYLMGACGIMFDREAVDALLHFVPLYPKGIPVKLSDGRRGIVIRNTGMNNLRPVVRLLDFTEVDLSEPENMSVTILSDIISASNIQESEEERQKMMGLSCKPRILVVDDMKTNLLMLREILERQYDLSLAKSGQQAITFVEKKACPDLVLMDIDMPEMDGIETAKRIQEMTMNSIPIIFVTSICDMKTVLTCKEMKAAGYVVKPYKPAYIMSEVKRVLERAEEV